MKKVLYLITALACLAACQQEESVIPEEKNVQSEESAGFDVIKGHIRVKFKTDICDKLQVVNTRNGVSTGISGLDLAGINLRAYRMERVFPEAGKFEARHRAAGLHLWYDIYFDEQVSTRSAVEEYDALPEIDIVEEIREARLLEATPIPAYMQPILILNAMAASALSSAFPTDAETHLFNDPRLGQQWHYHNTGSTVNGLVGALAGADINLYQAWKSETGSKEVIVAVMDGGIQFDHPDLAANMWINLAEKNGTPGVDDDHNGYVDDVYGFNFATGKKENNLYTNGAVTQHEHGTHCAGTISAVNNNGIGVCGIAGGSGKGDGARLMSCQMFHTDQTSGKDVSGGGPNMYVYAADNGAVISQNSWTNGPGSEESFLNSALRVAIDYFIDHAGTDLNGKQIGPMKGGMVIFAAANRNSDVKEWPASYDRNFRVAAMAHNFKKASYSNYGNWVDITAPGGEQSYGNEYAILSTTINGGYTWLQGTSMACPHVSGCAALVLSKFQGQGYTSQDLRERLMNTVGNINQYNSKYTGQMGAGYIDVGTALTPPSTEAPAVTPLSLIDSYDSWAIFEWNVVAAADGPLAKYEFCWSTEPIAGRTTETAVINKKIYDVKFKKAGDLVRDTVKNLESDTKYYYTLRGADRWGVYSQYSGEISAVTVKNNAPAIKPKWSGEVRLDEGAERILALTCTDPEGQHLTFNLTPSLPWVNGAWSDGSLQLKIAAAYGIAGKYSVNLEVIDQYGAKSTLVIPFEIMPKTVAPVIVSQIQNLTLSLPDGEQVLSLNDYFRDPANTALIYEIENTDSQVAFVQRKDNQLIITPKAAGVASVLVRAVNSAKLSASQRFTVNVYTTAGTSNWSADIKDNKLTIRVKEALQGNAIIRLYNVAGRQVAAKEVTIGAAGYVMDISSLGAGVYVLSIECQGVKMSQNIVKS